MLPTGMIDLHCDTLTIENYRKQIPHLDTLNSPDCHLSLGAMPAGTKWAQCFAIFIPDQLRGQDAIDFFDRYAASFYAQMEKNKDLVLPCRCHADMERAFAAGKFAAILTVEGGAVLAGRLERVQAIREAGVRMMTLTWNGANELGIGRDGEEGLTPFGREAVAELERQGVLVDVSHLSDKGFEDVLAAAKKPFVASHSNARSVCSHGRNLPDEYIREMAARGGLIGLNYSRGFLEDGARGSLDDLYRHVCRFLELGAEKSLALGSDFDGTDIHPDLASPRKALGIYSYLREHGIPEDTADGILFGNAWAFLRRWMQ